MDIPAPLRAFVEALPADAGGFVVELDGWRLTRQEPAARLTGLSGWRPDAATMAQKGIDRAVSRTAIELGIAADEIARANRSFSDIASLSQPIPPFEDDPLAAEKTDDGPGLTDKARSDFAAATAPPAE